MVERTDKMRISNQDDQLANLADDDDLLEDATAASEYEDENTEQLQVDIEETRSEMSQTINEIQARLSPEHLMGQVKQTVRDATLGKVEKAMDMVSEKIGDVAEPALEAVNRAGNAIKETGSSVADKVWKNPIPVALIGLGVAILVRRWGKKNGYDASERMTIKNASKAADSQHIMSKTVSQVRQKTNDLARYSTDTISNLSSQAKERASAIGARFGEVLRENPLAIGAVAVVAGTAAGLALPSTTFERKYIGETSEMLVDKAEEAARGALDKVETVAKKVGTEQTNENQPS